MCQVPVKQLNHFKLTNLASMLERTTEKDKTAPNIWSESALFETQPKLFGHITSRKHTYIILTLLNSTFISKTWVYMGYKLFFLFMLKSIDCGYSLEPPRRGGSNAYPQSMFWAELWKISECFYLKIFIFLVVKFSVYLNRRVFVMYTYMYY